MTFEIKWPLLFFAFPFLLFSCKTAQQTTLNNSVEIQESPKLLFLNYHIKKEGQGYHVELINNIITEGKLKKTNNSVPKPGDIECLLLSKNKSVLNKLIIEHPFIKHFETMGEDGSLQSKQIEFQEIDLPIKMQFPPEAEFIVLYLISENNQKTELTTNHLNRI